VIAALIIVVLISSIRMSAVSIDRISYNQEAIKEGAVSMDVREYRPIWMRKRKDWEEGRHDELRQSAVLGDSGDDRLRSIDDAGIRQTYTVSAVTDCVLRFRTLYFPGWVARINGEPTEMVPSKDGNIQVRVKQGEHSLTLSFEDSWPRVLGKLLSVFGVG